MAVIADEVLHASAAAQAAAVQADGDRPENSMVLQSTATIGTAIMHCVHGLVGAYALPTCKLQHADWTAQPLSSAAAALMWVMAEVAVAKRPITGLSPPKSAAACLAAWSDLQMSLLLLSGTALDMRL